MLNQHFPCTIHPKYTLDYLCLEPQCEQKGLACFQCIQEDHPMHQNSKINDYVVLIRQKQCTDSDLLKLKQIYQQMSGLIDKFVELFTQQLTNFKRQISAQLQKELISIESMKQHQKEQMKLLNKCQTTQTSSNLSSALVELSDFNQESRIFENFDIIKGIINKNMACVKNLETEGTKISKDFEAYLNQLVRYLAKDIGNLNNVPFGSSRAAPLINFDSNHQHSAQHYIQTPDHPRVGSGSLSQPGDLFQWRQESIIQVQTTPQQSEKVEAMPEQQFDIPVSPKVGIQDLGKYAHTTTFQKDKNPIKRQNSSSLTTNNGKNSNIYVSHYGEQPQTVSHAYSSHYGAPTHQPSTSVPPVDFYSEIKQTAVHDQLVPGRKLRSRIGTDNSYQPSNASLILGQEAKPQSSVPDQQFDQPSFQKTKFEVEVQQPQKKVQPPPKIQMARSSSSQSNFLADSRIMQNNNDLASIQKSGLHQKFGFDDCKIYQSPAKVVPGNLRQSSVQAKSSVQGSSRPKIYDASIIPSTIGKMINKGAAKSHANVIVQIVILDDAIYTCGDDGFLRSFGKSNGVQLSQVQASKDGIMCMSVFHDKSSTFAAIGCQNGQVLMFQFVNNNWKKIQVLKNDLIKQSITQVAFVSQLGTSLFTFTQGGDIAIYNWLSTDLLLHKQVWEGDPGKSKSMPIYACAVQIQVVTRKSKVVLMLGGGHQQGIVCVWTGDTQLQLSQQTQFKAHTRPVTRIDFAMDYVVTCAKYDDEIKLWDSLNLDLKIVNIYPISKIIKEAWTVINMFVCSNTILISSHNRTQDTTRITNWNLENLTSFVVMATEPGKFSQLYYDSTTLVLGDLKGNLVIV